MTFAKHVSSSIVSPLAALLLLLIPAATVHAQSKPAPAAEPNVSPAF